MNSALELPVASIEPYRTRILKGFYDSSFCPAGWNTLVAAGETNAINMTWEMHAAWWQANGRGTLLPILAERGGLPVALAPLFADGGMVFNICLLDHLDFIGDVSDPAVLEALLVAARDAVPGFVGFRFYFIPETAATGKRLQAIAPRVGLTCVKENWIPCPVLDLGDGGVGGVRAAQKKSLLRHERAFTRDAPLEVEHLRRGSEIMAHLPAFFDQHVARRAFAGQTSAFADAAERAFYIRMTELAGNTGWLRFTRIMWKDRPIAYHYGCCYAGRYLYGVPSFDVDVADRWPGEVLLRQLLLAAAAEGASCFDFGIGDEPYKRRFATRAPNLETWGLYP